MPRGDPTKTVTIDAFTFSLMVEALEISLEQRHEIAEGIGKMWPMILAHAKDRLAEAGSAK